MAQSTIKSAERNDFSQLSLLHHRDFVEKPAIRTICQKPRNLRIVDKLHRVEQCKAFGLNRIAEIGIGDYQIKETRLTPHLGSLDYSVEIPKLRKPETFAKTELCFTNRIL